MLKRLVPREERSGYIEKQHRKRLYKDSRLEIAFAVFLNSSRHRSTGQSMQLLVGALRCAEGGFPKGFRAHISTKFDLCHQDLIVLFSSSCPLHA